MSPCDRRCLGELLHISVGGHGEDRGLSSASIPLPESSGVCLHDTHDPSTPVRGHVTEDFLLLGLVVVQINGVDARGRVSIQHGLGAVPGEWVQDSSCGMRRKSGSLRAGLGQGLSGRSSSAH